MAIPVLELYCGLGGCAAAVESLEGFEVATAADLDRRAVAVYRENFSHPVHVRQLPAGDLERLDAGLWWLSPPCQPFTTRGRRRDADDPRAATFLRTIGAIERIHPPRVALENVPGFVGSRVHGRLREVLDRAGYRVAEHLLCPGELGWPNRRRRWYLTASLPATGAPPSPVDRTPLAGAPALADLVDETFDRDPHLLLDPDTAHAYRHALHVVDRHDPGAVTACFTSAYGRSPVRSGSYLRLPDGRLRRFHPSEVLCLLGFPAHFAWPGKMTVTFSEGDFGAGWKLAGNSLSLPAVRRVMKTLVAAQSHDPGLCSGTSSETVCGFG
jgi:DNA (cytosine-5)-methyltransferase 1